MANNTNGRPVAEIRVGRITATIWQNTPTDEGVFYSVHITRLFRRGGTAPRRGLLSACERRPAARWRIVCRTGRSPPRRRCLSGPGWPTPWRPSARRNACTGTSSAVGHGLGFLQGPFPERPHLRPLPGGCRGDEAAALGRLGLAVEDRDQRSALQLPRDQHGPPDGGADPVHRGLDQHAVEAEARGARQVRGGLALAGEPVRPVGVPSQIVEQWPAAEVGWLAGPAARRQQGGAADRQLSGSTPRWLVSISMATAAGVTPSSSAARAKPWWRAAASKKRRLSSGGRSSTLDNLRTGRF